MNDEKDEYEVEGMLPMHEQIQNTSVEEHSKEETVTAAVALLKSKQFYTFGYPGCDVGAALRVSMILRGLKLPKPRSDDDEYVTRWFGLALDEKVSSHRNAILFLIPKTVCGPYEMLRRIERHIGRYRYVPQFLTVSCVHAPDKWRDALALLLGNLDQYRGPSLNFAGTQLN